MDILSGNADTFKAVVVTNPGEATIQERAIPTIGPDEALIKVAYTGVCGTDLEIYHGTLGYFHTGLSTFPLTPGHEFSGTVMEIGSEVTNLQLDDRVVVECIQSCGSCTHCQHGNYIACGERTEVGVMRRNGAYAEYMVTAARFVHKIPESVNMKAAALCEPLAVVLKGLRRIEAILEVGDRKRCAVIGCGPIGHLCAQVLQQRGHQVVGFDRNPHRRQYLVDVNISPSENLTELDDFDIIVEATGDPDVLHTAFRHSRAGTTFLLLGLPYARREFSFEDVVAYDKMVIGSVGSTDADFAQAINLLPELSVANLTKHVMPLEKYQDSWTQFNEKTILKILLQCNK